MLYYRVKPESDQTKPSILGKNTILIQNEIYTAAQVDKAIKSGLVSESFVEKHLTPVNVSPKNTYYFFGARFEVGKGLDSHKH